MIEILQGATDLGSMSDSLEIAATTWAETYHLAKARNYVLRPFALDQAMQVLEVGAGCGAITRYLAETCDLVDALEPVLQRAQATRLRTSDLDNVEVFVGSIEDIPAQAAYDLITLVGVFEYVGDGTDRVSVYSDFLARLRALLRPGGAILIAIENRLGSKYLAGAAEDHTGRPFDGVEGYPRGGRARTFTRHELTSIATEAGLATRFFHAFPDYKLSRCVLADDLFALAPEKAALAWRIPSFPSPNYVGPRAQGVDERHLWRGLVEEGLGPYFSNSFVVLASEQRSNLWPDPSAGFYFTPARRSIFATATSIQPREGRLRLERRLLKESSTASSGRITLEPQDSDFIPGIGLVETMSRASDPELTRQLQTWAAKVRELTRLDLPGDPFIDLIPQNFVVTPHGALATIDQEWRVRDATETDVIERGIYWLAWDLAQRTLPERWPALTQTDLVRDLAARVPGIGLVEMEALLEREAALQTEINHVPNTHPLWASGLAQVKRSLRQVSDTTLRAHSFDTRNHAELVALTDDLRAWQARWARLEQHILMRIFRSIQRVLSSSKLHAKEQSPGGVRKGAD